MTPDELQKLIAQNEGQTDALINTIGLRLLDPTVSDDFRRHAVRRLRHLADFVAQQLGE